MADMHEHTMASSKESEIDMRLDALVAKIMAKEADAKELIEYEELLASRIRLMRPNPIRVRFSSGLRRKYA